MEDVSKWAVTGRRCLIEDIANEMSQRGCIDVEDFAKWDVVEGDIVRGVPMDITKYDITEGEILTEYVAKWDIVGGCIACKYMVLW